MSQNIEMVDVNNCEELYMTIRTQSMAYPEVKSHIIHCTCDINARTFIQEKYHSLKKFVRTKSCRRVSKWLSYLNVPENREENYRQILSTPFSSDSYDESEKQLELDLNRTFPDLSYFSQGEEGQLSLRRVLIALSKYYNSIGYVQGMNYIAGALLWHATESDTFWLVVGLFEKYDLLDNFLPKLPGLYRHCRILDNLLRKHCSMLYSHLRSRKITVELYVTDWCMTLFCSMVPIQKLSVFFDNFFQFGWVYFYKVVIHILLQKQNCVLQCNELATILNLIRLESPPTNQWRRLIGQMRGYPSFINIHKAFKKACKIKIDEDYVRALYEEYSQDCKSARDLRWSILSPGSFMQP
jgi:hypothetical protein